MHFCVTCLLGFVALSSSLWLSCDRMVACPGSVVTCECTGAVGFLTWTVLPGSDCTTTYTNEDTGVHRVLCDEGHRTELNSVGTVSRDGIDFRRYNSSLNVTLLENRTVVCMDTLEPQSDAFKKLMAAGKFNV